jgi:primosomal protein N' (replication factor Y)
MKYVGAGTQRAEEELHALFPGTEILRMDADTVARRGGHERILERFQSRSVPILLGTQMVAKGLDFGNVTLVGVLAADLSLYVDHYCAAERTFDLLTQVIGRAGRGEKDGRAVIQTYTPESEVLQCAARQDYRRFYQREIQMRKLQAYPPVSDLLTLAVTGLEEGRVLRASAALRDAMRQAADGRAMQVVGPAPALIANIHDRYRYHVYLVARNDKKVRDFIAHFVKEFSRGKENRALRIFVNCNATD